MRRLSRERRLAVLAACLASFTASTSSVISRHAHGLSDGAQGLIVGLQLGVSMALLGLSFAYFRRDRTSCSRNTKES